MVLSEDRPVHETDPPVSQSDEVLDCLTRALLVRYRHQIDIQSVGNTGYGHQGYAGIQAGLIVHAGLATGGKENSGDAFRTKGCELRLLALGVLAVVSQQQGISSVLEHLFRAANDPCVEGIFNSGNTMPRVRVLRTRRLRAARLG